MKARILSAMLAAVVLAGCQSTTGGGPTPSPSSTRPRSTASISIVQPAANSVITTTTVHVQFNLTGGRIVNLTTKNITPDTGHIHLFIDGRLISMNYQLQQDVAMSPFAPGPHILEGEFVAADHLPFSPPVVTKVIIEYQPPGSS